MFAALNLAAIDYSSAMKSSLALIGVGGFLAAVIIGSIAWFNAKKPAGWENAETPDWIPKVDTNEVEKSDSEN